MKVKEMNNGILLTKDNGETFELSHGEFNEMVREGKHMEVRKDVINHLKYLAKINNIDANLLLDNENTIQYIVDRMTGAGRELFKYKDLFDSLLEEHQDYLDNVIVIDGYPLNYCLPPMEIEIKTRDLQKIFDVTPDLGFKTVNEFLSEYTWDDTATLEDVIRHGNIELSAKPIINDFAKAQYAVDIFTRGRDFQVECLWPESINEEFKNKLLNDYDGYYIKVSRVGETRSLVEGYVNEGMSEQFDFLIKKENARMRGVAGRTDIPIGSVVKFAHSYDERLIGTVGQITNIFPGIMDVGYEDRYVAGLHIMDAEGNLTGEVCNITEDDTIEVIQEAKVEQRSDRNQIKIFHNTDEEHKEMMQKIKTWSSSAWDLWKPDSHESITEDDLPVELKNAYNKLYSELYGSYCFLIETPEGYGVGLSNEYDCELANEHGLTMKELFDCACKDAEQIAKHVEFEKAEIYVTEEKNDVFKYHEVLVVFPANTPTYEFQQAADLLDKLVYKSVETKEHSSVDDRIQQCKETSKDINNNDAKAKRFFTVDLEK